MLSRFRLIPERDGQTDRQTDGQTELLYQYRVSVLTRDKNLKRYITVKTHCSMTHLKEQKSFGFS